MAHYKLSYMRQLNPLIGGLTVLTFASEDLSSNIWLIDQPWSHLDGRQSQFPNITMTCHSYHICFIHPFPNPGFLRHFKLVLLSCIWVQLDSQSQSKPLKLPAVQNNCAFKRKICFFLSVKCTLKFYLLVLSNKQKFILFYLFHSALEQKLKVWRSFATSWSKLSFYSFNFCITETIRTRYQGQINVLRFELQLGFLALKDLMLQLIDKL